MGIEFVVGRSDHIVVEDYLSQQGSAVDAITVNAKNANGQKGLLEAARARGIDVLVDPVTDRLTEIGYSTDGIDYADQYPIDTATLNTLPIQAEFAERVLTIENEFANVLVPPYFYAESEPLLELNVALAGLGAQLGRQVGKRVRAVVAAPRGLLTDDEVCKRWAREYSQAGVSEVELRLSPLGGEDESHRKISSALRIVEVFKATGLNVILGMQACIGQTALALGVVDG